MPSSRSALGLPGFEIFEGRGRAGTGALRRNMLPSAKGGSDGREEEKAKAGAAADAAAAEEDSAPAKAEGSALCTARAAAVAAAEAAAIMGLGFARALEPGFAAGRPGEATENSEAEEAGRGVTLLLLPA